MNASYIVKKCKSVGFTQSLEQAHDLAKACFPRVIELSRNTTNSFKDIVPTLTPKSASASALASASASASASNATIIVELAHKEVREVSFPRASPTVDKPLMNDHGVQEMDTFGVGKTYKEITDIDEIVRVTTTEHYSKEFMEAVIMILNNPEVLKDQDGEVCQLSTDMLYYITEIYGCIQDTKARRILSGVLFDNHVPTRELEKEFPIIIDREDREVIIKSELFNDITVSVGDNEKGQRSSVYKVTDETIRNAGMGKSSQLEAFSENNFVVIHNKKSACINSNIRELNHHVLDCKAINGVVRSPELRHINSFEQLVKQLELFNQFDIIFVHPSLEVPRIYFEYPNQEAIPNKYTLGEGEILSIAYWYIVTNFFGYCSVTDADADPVDVIM
jgi:hypothetical protein